MLKVSNVVDRVFRDWLYPPDYQPTQTSLTSDIDSSTATIPYNSSIITPEELDLVAGGTLIEINQEAMIVDSIDEQANTITISTRGANETTATSHSSGDQIFITPPFYRKTVFDTVSDTIVSYYPDLYAIRTSPKLSVGSDNMVEIPADAHIPTDLYMQDGLNWYQTEYQHFPNFPGVNSKNAILIPRFPRSTNIYISYHGPFQRPDSEDDTLNKLGFRDQWVKLLTVGAVLHLIGSRDIDTISQTHIAQVLQAEYQPSRNTSIRRDMLQYENLLLERARGTLYAESDIPMSINRGI